MDHLFHVPRGIREQALYTSFLNMVPGLLMAGARSPDPSQAARGYGAAIQGFGQGGRDYMNDWRNMQAFGFATEKAQREKEAAARQKRAQDMIMGTGDQPNIAWNPMAETDPRYPGTVAQAYPTAAAQMFKPQEPFSLSPGAGRYNPAGELIVGRAATSPGGSATERLIAGRNALLLKQSRGETLSNEERLNLNSWNDALIKGYVVPEGGDLRRVVPGSGTPLPTPGQLSSGGATQVGPASPIPSPSQAVPPQLQPRTEQRLRPLPRDVQDDLTSSLGMKRSLDQIAAGLHKSGRITGNIEKAKIWAGIASKEGMDFDTAQKNFRVAAQALIKGIPSNFDVQTFINTLPDLGLPEQTNTARYSFALETLKELVATKISYYKGLQYQIPDETMALAADLGIGDAPAMSQGQATARLNVLQKGLKQFQSGGGDTGGMSLEDAARLDLNDPKNRELLDRTLKARGF